MGAATAVIQLAKGLILYISNQNASAKFPYNHSNAAVVLVKSKVHTP